MKPFICLILGVLLVAAAPFVKKHMAEKESRCTASVVAHVVNNTPSHKRVNGKLRTSYHYKVEYTVDGKKYGFRGKTGSANEYKSGTSFTLRYNPKDPGERIEPGKGSTKSSLKCALAGAILALIGFFWMWQDRKKRPVKSITCMS